MKIRDLRFRHNSKVEKLTQPHQIAHDPLQLGQEDYPLLLLRVPLETELQGNGHALVRYLHRCPNENTKIILIKTASEFTLFTRGCE